MEAIEFEKGLLDALNKLDDNDVKRIREKIGVNSDYEIDEDGFTHLVVKSKSFVEANDVDMYKESAPEIKLENKNNLVDAVENNDYQLAA
ncbi:hypothetical protein [Liquorilactobacillus cacaonum]|uniref:Uncharacterized protein n=1 Tax=Liquorilactobacillus cacaonum DSM 21116 TaxID=1423729 RepID=A0A0R2CU00_9LACO|nr:hypothetical protein [Liquorilactobacillus cacaonum]KRM91510.1 hypothetical protein FC80_GL000478 [Liquorilactobacillus cacaonum DSM 21116]